MAKPFFEEESSARWLLAGVIGLTLLNSGVSVAFSYIGRDFWTALSNKDPDQFAIMLQRFLGALVAGVPVTVFYRFQRETLSLAWREWMTARVLAIYYSSRTYYTLEAEKDIDNPDQRIAEDVRAFTAVSLEFLIAVLTAGIDLVSFSTILFKIYPQLFIAIVTYAGAGTVGAAWLGKPLVGLNFEQLLREADFRYSLVRVRENAESIAFYGGEQLELHEIGRRFMRLIDNTKEIIRTQRNLEFLTVGYRYLIQVLPGFVVAPLYFQGKVELGVVSQSYGAFNHILSDLSLIVTQFESLSKFSAGVDRLGQFLERMQDGASYVFPEERALKHVATAALNGDATEKNLPSVPLLRLPAGALVLQREADPAAAAAAAALRPPNDQTTSMPLPMATKEGEEMPQRPGVAGVDYISVDFVPGTTLQVEDLSVSTPAGGRELLRGVSFDLPAGERLLVVGESGAGKSSLLRALAGLWTAGRGRVVRPPADEVFFLPQRPYCTLGPLRDQITYPQRLDAEEARTKDSELLELLRKVDLGNLPRLMGGGNAAQGLSAVRDWSDMLSLGEQQRLAFARLLYNKPRLAFLDEASSALDLANEERMYGLLNLLPGLAVVSVGHRPSLERYHTSRLRLRANCEGFEVEALAPAAVVAK